jgi:pimeloyl-ACP methyl ester carboxylesterase
MIGFKQFGQGEHKVIALHGWFGDERTYDALQPALDPDRFAYASMAYRGYGMSKDIAGSYTMDEIAADALSLADQLGWTKFSLVGHSMGGKAIQRIAANAPQRVRKLVAITPVPAFAVPFDDAAWALFEGAASDPQKRYAIVDMSTGNRLSSRWVQSIVDNSRATSSREAFAGYLHAWAKSDFAADVADSKIPIKVFVGRYDQSITEDVAKAGFATFYSDCEISVIDNAGHYPTEETPIALATEIEAFLAK